MTKPTQAQIDALRKAGLLSYDGTLVTGSTEKVVAALTAAVEAEEKETTMEHIARDIKEGRFPNMSKARQIKRINKYEPAAAEVGVQNIDDRTEHLKRFIMVGLHTGSRLGVIKRLQWDWINLEAMTMGRRQPGTVEDAHKKTPPIRLPRKLAHFMRRWKRDGVPYVVHYDGQPIKTDPHTAWKTACKRARLTGVTIHTMRHTRATWAMQRGKDLWATAGFLGMTPKVLAETYGHHHPDY